MMLSVLATVIPFQGIKVNQISPVQAYKICVKGVARGMICYSFF